MEIDFSGNTASRDVHVMSPQETTFDKLVLKSALDMTWNAIPVSGVSVSDLKPALYYEIMNAIAAFTPEERDRFYADVTKLEAKAGLPTLNSLVIEDAQYAERLLSKN